MNFWRLLRIVSLRFPISKLTFCAVLFPSLTAKKMTVYPITGPIICLAGIVLHVTIRLVELLLNAVMLVGESTGALKVTNKSNLVKAKTRK